LCPVTHYTFTLIIPTRFTRSAEDKHYNYPPLYLINKLEMKASIVAAALVGSVAASQHKAHGGFHNRRGGYAAAEVCEVYTHTVYVTART
jgi:hypothetical protein